MKLQPYKVAATEKSIYTVSIGKINYRRLLKWMYVTYEWTDELTWKFYYCACHEKKSRLLGKLFLLLYKQGWNLILIMSNHFDVMWINGHKLKIPLLHYNQARIFKLLLLGQIRWYPGFRRWSLSFTKNKKLTDFTEKSVLHYYVQFLQIRSHMKILLFVLS